MSTDAKPTVDPFAGLPAIFKDCSDPEAVRYALDLPFVQDGHVYATDGRIIVRMPWAGPEPPEWAEMRDGRRTPSPAVVFNSGHEDTETPLPTETLNVPKVTCGQCNGCGRITCPWCHGSGDDPDWDDVCDECGGLATLECDDCDEGLTDPDGYERALPVGNLKFDRRLLAMLQKHGVTGLYLPTDPSTDANRATRFVLGDIEGRIMPMSDR